MGDSLEKLKIIDFESFRPLLESVFCKERKSNAGRPPFDVVMMFKILVLQRLFNLSDDQTEYQITDRMSFQRFIGLSLGERVPDAKTIWLFRDTLTKSGVICELFIRGYLKIRHMKPNIEETHPMKAKEERNALKERRSRVNEEV